jgi:hypothetical protein
MLKKHLLVIHNQSIMQFKGYHLELIEVNNFGYKLFDFVTNFI